MLEILGALGIGVLLILGLMGMIDGSIEDARGKQAAAYQTQMVEATRRYIGANYGAVKLASAGAMLPITPAQLQAVRFLPDGFAATNTYGQRICALVRQVDPVRGTLDVLVVTVGGTQIGDKDIALVALSGGQGSGYITTEDPTRARGGSWNFDTGIWRGTACGGGALLTGGAIDGGHLVSNLFFDGPPDGGEFISRVAVPNRPELNQINTTLRLAGTGVIARGAPCPVVAGVPDHAIAIEAGTQYILSCGADGNWMVPDESPWKEGAPSYAALPAGGNTAGDVRMAIDIGRAFMFDGANWVALAEDEFGDLRLRRDLTAQTITTTGNLVSGAAIAAGGHITTPVDVTVGTNLITGSNTEIRGNLVTNGEIATTGRITGQSDIRAGFLMAAPQMVATRLFTHGDACHTVVSPELIYDAEGTIAMDANYRTLVCSVNHVWTYDDGT